MCENLDGLLTVENLAERVGMSTRQFTRAFVAETGTTPAKAVERLRVEAAQARVQSSGELIEQVALATGFGNSERMRRTFV
ncbi:MAG: helix-turn-helix domain-containing protein, partial [Deltaproteobacteria bacterium]